MLQARNFFISRNSGAFPSIRKRERKKCSNIILRRLRHTNRESINSETIVVTVMQWTFILFCSFVSNEAEGKKDPVDYRFLSWCTFLSSSQSWRDAKPLLSACQTSGLLVKRHSNLISTCGVLHSHPPDVATLADVTQKPSDFLLLSVGYERIVQLDSYPTITKRRFECVGEVFWMK